MDVHRCRFVPYPASEINALAFSHRSNPNEPNPPQLRLALGRSNGDIEIWNPLGGSNWTQETILKSGKDRTIEGLAWTQDLESETAGGKKIPGKLRLFSIGYSTYITEWDLALGRAIRHSGGNYGEVWCMAAQPRAALDKKTSSAVDSNQEQFIALGCADGSVVLHSTADGELNYVKTLPRSTGKKPRVMSLAWQGRNRIVAGYSDSTIRVFDTAGRGQVVASMSLGAVGKGSSADILVWTVSSLKDDTIVSGDSTGEIKIWDSRNHTLVQRIKSHLADVLTLAVSSDSSLILSGGMDRRTTLYQKDTSPAKGHRGRWSALAHQRNHQSDVKSMAVFESRQMSVVVSGGADATPVVNPLRAFGQQYHRALPPFPRLPVVSSAPQARLMLSWWDHEVWIWHIEERTRLESEDDVGDDEQGYDKTRSLVRKIAVKGEESITSAQLNSSGDIIIIATMSEIKAFHLRSAGAASTKLIRKIEPPSTFTKSGAKQLSFSPDGKWLACALLDNSMQLHRLTYDKGAKQPWRILETTVRLERSHARSNERVTWGTHGRYDLVASKIAWSSDSRILVVGDLGGNLDTWVLEGAEDPDWTSRPVENGTHEKPPSNTRDSNDDDSDEEDEPQIILGQHWKPHTERLPRLPSTPLALSFRPDAGQSQTNSYQNGNVGLHATRQNPTPHSHDMPRGESRLLAITAKHEILEFNVLDGKLTDWSKRNPSSVLPLSFRNVLDRTMDCIWDVSGDQERAWVYGSTWLWMFDLKHDLPQEKELIQQPSAPTASLVPVAEQSKKRKRDLSEIETRQLIKQSSGAGSRIPDDELSHGVGARLKTFLGDEPSEVAVESTFEASKAPRDGQRRAGGEDVSSSDSDSDSDSLSEAERDVLVQMRRRENDASDDGSDGREDRDDGGEEGSAQDAGLPPHHWHTFKYRPILGIAPLQHAAADSDHAALEVALIERPLFEADLRPRWEGPQDWDTR